MQASSDAQRKADEKCQTLVIFCQEDLKSPRVHPDLGVSGFGTYRSTNGAELSFGDWEKMTG